MLRKTIWTVVIVVVLLVIVGGIAVGVIWSNQDELARRGIERGTANALGVNTQVDSVSLSLFAGGLHAEGFTAANPEGYESAYLLRNESIDIEVVPSSFFADTLDVREIEINGLEMNIEQREGTSNIQVVSEHLSGGADEQAPEAGRKIRVDHIIIRDIVAHVRGPRIPGDEPIVVRIPEVELNDVTPENVKGLAVAELTERIMPVVLAAVIENGAGMIPEQLLDDLGGSLEEMAEQLGEEGIRIIREAGGEAVDTILRDVDPELKKAIEERIGGAVEGLLGGEKKSPNPDAADGATPEGGVTPTDGVEQGVEDAGERIRGLFDREK